MWSRALIVDLNMFEEFINIHGGAKLCMLLIIFN